MDMGVDGSGWEWMGLRALKRLPWLAGLCELNALAFQLPHPPPRLAAQGVPGELLGGAARVLHACNSKCHETVAL